MDNQSRQKYRIKAKDSFITKKNLFLFSIAIQEQYFFSDQAFRDFIISDDLVKIYSAEYWQQHETYKINNLTIKEISERIEKIEKEHHDKFDLLQIEYLHLFQSIFPEKDFDDLINRKVCHYCQISLDEIEILGERLKLFKKNLRGWKLEIDRLNSNKEYRPENCVMACYWCNNAKTDEFSENEFLQIGLKINEIWKTRLL